MLHRKLVHADKKQTNKQKNFVAVSFIKVRKKIKQFQFKKYGYD